MPVTPYHLGPGAAIKAVMPRHFSFTIFCFAQIVTDSETAYYILQGEYPLHRWFYTYLGATIVAVACVVVGLPGGPASVDWLEEGTLHALFRRDRGDFSPHRGNFGVHRHL